MRLVFHCFSIQSVVFCFMTMTFYSSVFYERDVPVDELSATIIRGCFPPVSTWPMSAYSNLRSVKNSFYNLTSIKVCLFSVLFVISLFFVCLIVVYIFHFVLSGTTWSLGIVVFRSKVYAPQFHPYVL